MTVNELKAQIEQIIATGKGNNSIAVEMFNQAKLVASVEYNEQFDLFVIRAKAD